MGLPLLLSERRPEVQPLAMGAALAAGEGESTVGRAAPGGRERTVKSVLCAQATSPRYQRPQAAVREPTGLHCFQGCVERNPATTGPTQACRLSFNSGSQESQ